MWQKEINYKMAGVDNVPVSNQLSKYENSINTVCTGLVTQCKGTGVPSNSRPPPFSLAGSPASKREQNSGVGLELDVNGTKGQLIANREYIRVEKAKLKTELCSIL